MTFNNESSIAGDALANAIADVRQRDEDIGKFLVPHLNKISFYHVTHVYQDIEEQSMTETGGLCESFVNAHMNGISSNQHLQSASEMEKKTHLKHLWMTAYSNKTIAETFNAKRTSTHGSVRTHFLHK